MAMHMATMPTFHALILGFLKSVRIRLSCLVLNMPWQPSRSALSCVQTISIALLTEAKQRHFGIVLGIAWPDTLAGHGFGSAVPLHSSDKTCTSILIRSNCTLDPYSSLVAYIS